MSTPPSPTAGRDNLRRLGRRIRLVRLTRGYTQEELGDRASIAKNSIGMIERGETNVGVAYLWPLASALGVQVRDFFPDGSRDVVEELAQLPPSRQD